MATRPHFRQSSQLLPERRSSGGLAVEAALKPYMTEVSHSKPVKLPERRARRTARVDQADRQRVVPPESD